MSDFEYSAITSNNLFTNAGGFLAKCVSLYPTPSPSTAVAITVACGTWEASFDLLLQLDGPRFAGLSEVYQTIRREQYHQLLVWIWIALSATNVVPYGYNGCLVIGDEIAMVGLPVWSWYFGFVIRTSSVLEFTCCLVRAIRTGTKMGSGTHSCRYLLQSNQYCNLFGLAKWISVNLNQTKCNATW